MPWVTVVLASLLVTWSTNAFASYNLGAFWRTKLNTEAYIVGGEDASNGYRTVYKTTNATTWSLVSSTALPTLDTDLAGVFFNNAFWIVGGADYSMAPKNVVWKSTDAATWTSPNPPNTLPGSRRNPMAVVFRSKIYVIGGASTSSTGSAQATVYSSNGSATWTTESVSGLTGVDSASCAVFNNKIWLVGGYSSATQNIIQYSSDGASWTNASPSTFPTTVRDGQMIAFGGYLWHAGGTDSGNNMLSSFYRSSDGLTWTAKANLPAVRAAGHLFSLGNYIYYAGGTIGGGTYKTDVYKYDISANTWTKVADLPVARAWGAVIVK